MKKPNVKGFFDTATSTWTYVVFNADIPHKSCAVIDSVLDYDIHSGRSRTTSADKVIEFIKSEGLVVQWILETHIHADHLTASAYIKEKLGGKTAISRHILTELIAWENIFHSSDTPLDGKQFDHIFADDEHFLIGSMEAYVMYTPGHTAADITYIIGDAVFVGDIMLLPDVGTGRCDFPSGNAERSYESCQKILALPDDFRMYVGHDYPKESREAACVTTVREQREANIRLHHGISKEEYIKKRQRDDHNKEVPKLLLPSIQVNLRAGNFGDKTHGIQYIKIPINVM